MGRARGEDLVQGCAGEPAAEQGVEPGRAEGEMRRRRRHGPPLQTRKGTLQRREGVASRSHSCSRFVLHERESGRESQGIPTQPCGEEAGGDARQARRPAAPGGSVRAPPARQPAVAGLGAGGTLRSPRASRWADQILVRHRHPVQKSADMVLRRLRSGRRRHGLPTTAVLDFRRAMRLTAAPFFARVAPRC